MGSWGVGLYSNDLAAELRPTISSLAKLPLSADQIVNQLCDLFPDLARQQDDEDYTTFWLVVADQLGKRKIYSEVAMGTAIKIISSGHDIRNLRALGMEEKDIIQRQKILAKLETSLRNLAPSARVPPKITKPLETVLTVGELFAYPVSGGKSVNPYFSPKVLEKYPFNPDGFGVFLVIRVGFAFDFLPWYQIALSNKIYNQLPKTKSSLEHLEFPSHGYGTLSKKHKERLMLQRIDNFELRQDAVDRLYPAEAQRALETAVSDITIANLLLVDQSVRPSGFSRWLHFRSGANNLRNLVA